MDLLGAIALAVVFGFILLLLWALWEAWSNLS